MPDRRQGERRQGIENKRITISLTTFIFMVVIVAIIAVFTVLCVVLSKVNYNKGYEAGLLDGASGKFEQLYDYNDYVPESNDADIRFLNFTKIKKTHNL